MFHSQPPSDKGQSPSDIGQSPSDIGNLRQFWVSCLDTLVYLFLKTWKLFGLPILWWAYLMKIIQETCASDWPMSEGDWPLSEGDWPLSEGDWPMSEGDWPLSEGDWPMSEGDWPISERLGNYLTFQSCDEHTPQTLLKMVVKPGVFRSI
jgi:hypothetical protein